MCGLAGELRPDGAAADVRAVARMAATMADRGPDAAGAWAAGPIALGHRRLKIIDLSEASDQPMADPVTGLVCAFNGCIYNYRELRGQLQALGHSFTTAGDTEVVLKAYAQWGAAFAEHLTGMFAVALVETRTGRLVLARDRLGIKPLYLAHTTGAVRFASTLPALLAGGGVDTSVDPLALAYYLSFHSVVPAPATILTGVRRLPPATVRIYQPDGRFHDRVYWCAEFARQQAQAGWSDRDWQDALQDALTTAVRRRMIADVPVGVLLSGGLDSSLLVALLARQGQRGLATYSIGFDPVNGRRGDEFAYSDLIARTFGTDHHRIQVGSADLLAPIESAVQAMSEPMISHDCVAFYLLGEAVSGQLKVVQSGQGADELLAGYHWYRPLEQVPRELAAATYASAFLDRDAAGLARVMDPHRLAAAGSADPAGDFVAAYFARRAGWSSSRSGSGSSPSDWTAVDAGLQIDTEVMLVDDPVKRLDTMMMAHGVEARVPFLDHEFVELAAACPPGLKLAHGGKGVLKELGRRLLPWEVIDRPKGYFPVPGLTHLEGKVLGRLHDVLTSPQARERNLFRRDYVERLLADPNSDFTPLNGNKLWQLGLLELWLQTHLPS